jgi:hypothetical protein
LDARKDAEAAWFFERSDLLQIAVDGRRLEVIYTEAKAGEVRIVSVAAS